MTPLIINPELTEQEKVKVKQLREHNPKLRLWLFEKHGFRTIATLYKKSQASGFKIRGYIVKEISLDFKTE